MKALKVLLKIVWAAALLYTGFNLAHKAVNMLSADPCFENVCSVILTEMRPMIYCMAFGGVLLMGYGVLVLLRRNEDIL
ncbi:hypothetical protein [Enterobacter hormaechei]|uniref:hypothetical protein n=1 Tax=Enterobacter hormaechei TaxID=158836 RepID=UPI0020B8D333|nr:hypothetical protein [Enterobacter hormaechei]UTI09383.1 hypothetical protein LZ581_22950 [Enterobacter hormaechei subsp. steigerwaltii]